MHRYVTVARDLALATLFLVCAVMLSIGLLMIAAFWLHLPPLGETGALVMWGLGGTLVGVFFGVAQVAREAWSLCYLLVADANETFEGAEQRRIAGGSTLLMRFRALGLHRRANQNAPDSDDGASS